MTERTQCVNVDEGQIWSALDGRTEGNSVAFQPYLVKREMICQHLAALCTCCSGSVEELGIPHSFSW